MPSSDAVSGAVVRSYVCSYGESGENRGHHISLRRTAGGDAPYALRHRVRSEQASHWTEPQREGASWEVSPRTVWPTLADSFRCGPSATSTPTRYAGLSMDYSVVKCVDGAEISRLIAGVSFG